MIENNNTQSSLEELSENRNVDSLLESLVFLSKYYQRAVSKASLTSGFATAVARLIFIICVSLNMNFGVLGIHVLRAKISANAITNDRRSL